MMMIYKQLKGVWVGTGEMIYGWAHWAAWGLW